MNIDLLACDLAGMPSIRKQVEEKKVVMVVSKGALESEGRRRAAAYTLCQSALQGSQYEHVHRVANVADMEAADKAVRGPALLWLDLMQGQSAAEADRETHLLRTIV